MTLRSTMNYDILTEFRRALTASEDPDPVNVARAVAGKVPNWLLRIVIVDLLRRFAPTSAGMDRHTARVAALHAKQQPPTSKRWSAAADNYNRLLSTRVPVNGRWKFLRDCTVDDLLHAAQRRYEHAEAVREQGARYEELARAMTYQGAATVSDLDRETFLEVAA